MQLESILFVFSASKSAADSRHKSNFRVADSRELAGTVDAQRTDCQLSNLCQGDVVVVGNWSGVDATDAHSIVGRERRKR